jgi:hypothetical protein
MVIGPWDRTNCPQSPIDNPKINKQSRIKDRPTINALGSRGGVDARSWPAGASAERDVADCLFHRDWCVVPGDRDSRARLGVGALAPGRRPRCRHPDRPAAAHLPPGATAWATRAGPPAPGVHRACASVRGDDEPWERRWRTADRRRLSIRSRGRARCLGRCRRDPGDGAVTERLQISASTSISSHSADSSTSSIAPPNLLMKSRRDLARQAAR